MKQFYSPAGKHFRFALLCLVLCSALSMNAQVPTTVTNGICTAVVADFNTNDNGYNSPSIYGSIFDSSFYYNASRGYWTDYMPPFRVGPPGFPRTMDIISPPYPNPSPVGTFNVGFYYIVGNPAVDRFQVRIISVTETPQGTVTDVEATSGVQFFSAWSTPTPYVDTGTAFLNGFSGHICIRLIDPDITNAPNTTYRVEVAYLINEPIFAVFDDLSIGSEQSPLPVHFIGLVAKRNPESVDLKWDVSEEINVQQYVVEMSTNGSMFNPVGTVQAKGKSLYTFTHYTSVTNTLFYRIKSVDIDGKAKYSGVIRVQGNASSSYGNKLTAYPIPAKNDIMVEHKLLSANAKLSISTLDGKLIKMIIPTDGSSHTPVSLTGMTSGMYILRLDDGNGSIETIKFVKD